MKFKSATIKNFRRFTYVILCSSNQGWSNTPENLQLPWATCKSKWDSRLALAALQVQNCRASALKKGWDIDYE